jgi:hypothetical protein
MGAPVADVAAAVPTTAISIVVGFTPFHRPPTRDAVLGELLASLRAGHPDTPIILADLYQSGQHYVEAAGDAVLASYPEADAFLKYEAEARLGSLLTEFGGRRPTQPVVVRGTEPPSLDALALPAWDLVDLGARDAFVFRVIDNLGRGPWAFPADGRTLPMLTSRGCPFRCAHCSSNPGRESIAGPKTQRRYSAEYLARATAALTETHGATRIDILDEMVNVTPGHLDGVLAACSRWRKSSRRSPAWRRARARAGEAPSSTLPSGAMQR